MFSGLVEAVGAVADVSPMPSGFGLRIACGLAASLSVGESVAVNGVCLTVVEADARAFGVEVSPETAKVTTLGGLTAGAPVNLERPLRPDGRLGGHFVLGHVDAVGRIDEVRAEADFHRVRFRFPPRLQPLIVEKGSIAVDGVSLTVVAPGRDRFDAQVIPHTWTHTNFRAAAAGVAVNLECDIIGKYVLRAVENVRGGAARESTPRTREDRG